ncbi:hypothetical protein [Homoserinibacter sp. GY 40078]|uniref:hypothetical protein n=1 Tax=Homoserinibacter sp. GY 40078 TaxID=2603275 RepID=UPI0011CBA0F0|nr:hypothetical protein [Homoserinibacter sp. GY 40078]TXK17088.1 hypothetical protein FVQ89_09430 [Homoserinibacter sp. GY 40078]
MTDPSNEQPTPAPAEGASPADAAAPGTYAPPVAPRKSRATLITVLVAVGVFVLVGIGVGTWAVVTALAGPTKQALIEQNVEEARNSYDLPAQVDEVTILTDIVAEESAIAYHYTLTGVDPTLVTEDLLRSVVQPALCSTPETEKLLDLDIAVKYTYEVEGTDDVYELEFTKDDC